MNPCVTFVKYFGKLEAGSAASEEEFRALKNGDRILVKLDGAEPEVSDTAQAELRPTGAGGELILGF
jgi:hypothetical protein